MNIKSPLTIVKIGGHVIDDAMELQQFLHHFSTIKGPKILIHGGGKRASGMSEQLGLTPQIVEGRRITDQKTLDVTVMIYAGLINKNIVAQLQMLHTNAIGLSGADCNSIESKKRVHPTLDFGFVGDVAKVNTTILELFLSRQLVPVFCAITHDKKGQLLNTNADTIAAEIASALAPIFHVSLFYCFEKQGVLLDINDPSSLVEVLSFEKYEKLKKECIIHSGMIPKLDNCFHALQKGVSKIVVGHHRLFQNKNERHTSISL